MHAHTIGIPTNVSHSIWRLDGSFCGFIFLSSSDVRARHFKRVSESHCAHQQQEEEATQHICAYIHM